MPRDASSTSSPHGRVRVYMNQTLLDSRAAGDGGIGAASLHPVGCMAIKEMYDESDTLVGAAVIWKDREGGYATGWTFHCWGPAGRCHVDSEDFTKDTPFHTQDDLNCSACHGGAFFSPLP
jgi:hypothetical protein